MIDNSQFEITLRDGLTSSIPNGTFDSNIDGWEEYNSPGSDTLEWVASGGGFTGALHYGSNLAGGVQYGYDLQDRIITAGKYKFTINLNITNKAP